jgi:hypothetical protein
MLKIKLILEAVIDIPGTGWKMGDTCEIINDIFDPKIGIAYYSIDKGWKVIKMELVEFRAIN